MERFGRFCGLAAVLYAVGILWLVHMEREGPPHHDFVVPPAIPATLMVPGNASPGRLPEVVPLEDRPPAVLLVHGYSNDRLFMRHLGRRLAGAGYGVLSIDVRGHGQNRVPFARDPDGAHLFEDVAAAADWLRTAAWVDGSRLAVVGFSMGGSAAQRFAERDSGVDATVLISGSRELLGPYRPPNTLILWGSADPERIHARSARTAAELAGEESLQFGVTYGDLAARNAVRAEELAGYDHATVVLGEAAAASTIDWLDAAFEIERGSPPNLRNPLLAPTLLLALLLIPVLLGVGQIVGALAPKEPAAAVEGSPWAGLVWFSVALGVGLVGVAAAPLASFVAQDVSEIVAGFLAIAGTSALVSSLLHGRAIVGGRFARSAAVGALGFGAVYVVWTPLAEFLHRMTPTPERALACLVLTLLLFPFFLAAEGLLHRGRWPVALAAGLAGRFVTVGVLVAGISLGIVPPVVSLLLAPLAIVLLLGELVAITSYAASHDRVAGAVLQAAWLGWMLAVVMPMRA